jgi:hypothetical protein
VVAGFKEGAKDGVALCRLLEADTFQVSMKDLLGLTDHLP